MVKHRALPVTFLLLCVIVVAGAFLRLWHFESTLQFLGDQGRDALTAKHILIDHHPVLIGPVTSTGNMYLGPLYYYFMVPFLAITYPNPIGPAYGIALFGILSIPLLYVVGSEMVGKRAALAAAFFLAFSAVTITFSRFSWNPNLEPFVAIIWLLAVFRTRKSNWYFVVAATCIAVLMQLHYVTLLVIPTTGIFWLAKLWSLRQPQHKSQRLSFVMATLAAIAIFLVFLTPLVVFDLRHDFLNVRSLIAFLFSDSGGFNHNGALLKITQKLAETHGRSLLILAELYFGKWRAFNSVFALFVVACMSVWALQKKQVHRIGYQLLILTVLFSALGLAFYQSSVFPHYLAFLFPVVCLIFGVLVDKVWSIRMHLAPVGMGVALLFGGAFLWWNLNHLPLAPIGWQLKDVQATAQTITQRVKPGEKYNLVLLTGTGDIEGQNYRYFLDTTTTPPLPKEQWGSAQTLFIINEDRKLAKVTDSPIYEIVVFPNKTPAEVYTIPGGPEITVLRTKK